MPTPEYIVFDNSCDMNQNRTTLYLSDSFSMGRSLECTCEVINIRRGYNQELLKKCRRLWEYSEFVSEIESNMQSGKSRDEAVQSTMDCCIRVWNLNRSP